MRRSRRILYLLMAAILLLVEFSNEFISGTSRSAGKHSNTSTRKRSSARGDSTSGDSTIAKRDRTTPKDHCEALSTRVTICSQNLHNFGISRGEKARARSDSQQSRSDADQLSALIDRFVNANCGIIAVQEVGGETRAEAESNLGRLTAALESATDRSYAGYISESKRGPIRNGYVVAKDLGAVSEAGDWTGSVPRLDLLWPAQHFQRYPMVLQVTFPNTEVGKSKSLLLVNVHFKSQVDGWKDPTGTRFELLRMEMAEAVRKYALERKTQCGGECAVVVLGDRNSDMGYASVDILAGRRVLADFRRVEQGGTPATGKTACRVDEELRAQCASTETTREPILVPLLESAALSERRIIGSYRYKGALTLLDEISISSSDLPLVSRGCDRLAVGASGAFGRGSDHKLIWAKLDW